MFRAYSKRTVSRTVLTAWPHCLNGRAAHLRLTAWRGEFRAMCDHGRTRFGATMTNDELSDAIDAISDRLSDLARAAVDYHADAKWLRNLLARAVLLTGGRDPLFADADIGEELSPQGSIVVITDTTIVRVSFRNPVRTGPEVAHVVSAESVPRSAVQRVRVVSLEAKQANDASWPGAVSVTLDLDRELTGESTLSLPLDNRAPARNARAIALARVAAG